MADEEHLAVLKTGVVQWNRWRAKHHFVQPDLKGAEFAKAHLVFENRVSPKGAGERLTAAVSGAIGGGLLGVIIFAGGGLRAAFGFPSLIIAGLGALAANISLINRVGVDFTNARLDGACFDGAVLRHARCRGANFAGASLVSADLRDSNLTGVSLKAASLDSALLGATIIADVDLRSAKGLESIYHLAPSPVSTSTLVRSQGKIPAEFLRGCGLSDWEIEAARLHDPDLTDDERTLIHNNIRLSQAKQDILQTRLFISYTRQDETFVESLEKRFDEKGVRYWRDVHDLKAGRLEHQIGRAITLYPLVLIVLSEKSVQNDWVEWEVAKARELEQELAKAGEERDVLCPVALDDTWKTCRWPGPLRRQVEDYNVLDFSGWENEEEMERQFQRLYEGMVLHYRRRDQSEDG